VLRDQRRHKQAEIRAEFEAPVGAITELESLDQTTLEKREMTQPYANQISTWLGNTTSSW
jgi:hypothetical protein